MNEERVLIEIEESPPYYYPPAFYNENEGLSKRSQREMGSFTWDGQD